MGPIKISKSGTSATIAARPCTKFRMRCDGAGMNIVRRRTPAAPGVTSSRFSKFYFTGQHTPTIKIRAPAPAVSSKFRRCNNINNSFNVRILLTYAATVEKRFYPRQHALSFQILYEGTFLLIIQ